MKHICKVKCDKNDFMHLVRKHKKYIIVGVIIIAAIIENLVGGI